MELASVPFPGQHLAPRKRAGCRNTNFAPFGRVQGIFTGDGDSLLASDKIVRVVTSRHKSQSQSRQSRVVDRTIANASFYA